MKPGELRRHRGTILGILVLLLLAIFLVILDWKEIRLILARADWHFTLVALLLTWVSYFVLSLGYALVNKLFGVHAKWRTLLQVGFVSATMNNMLAFLGLAGHSLRIILTSRQAAERGTVLAASLFHSFLHNTMMFVLPVAGLIWLAFNHAVSGGSVIAFALSAGVLFSSLAIVTTIMFVRPLRIKLGHIAGAMWRTFFRRDVSALLNSLDIALEHGTQVFQTRWRMLALLLGLMATDWTLAVAVLWFGFRAFGDAPNFGAALTGFGVGISAGNLSMVPGGLGIQEASMASVYALLGASFTQAALAAILFRVVYEFIPFFLSLAFYRPLLRKQ